MYDNFCSRVIVLNPFRPLEVHSKFKRKIKISDLYQIYNLGIVDKNVFNFVKI